MRRIALPVLLSLALVGCEWLPSTNPDQTDTRDETAVGSASSVMMDESSASAMSEEDGMKDEDKLMEEKKEDEVMEKKESSDDVMQQNGAYGDYSPSVLANGRTKVLFFHAQWCPVCREADAELTAWYGTHPFPLSVYKVDFDTNLSLKQEFGVVQQHTFVKVDGQGREIDSITSPTDQQLQQFIDS